MTVRRDRPAEPPWYELSGDQRALLAPLREFLRAEVAPGAAARDRDGGFPHELVGQLGALGVMGMQVPERYGRSGLDTATVALILEEIAAVDGSLCLTVASHNSLCIGHLLVAGDERQHAAWLPRLASGESLGAWCLTESGSGSDAAGLETRAIEVGDHFEVTGSKAFITQGSVGSTYVVMARTDPVRPDHPKADGISAFAFDGDTPGLLRGKPESKLGLNSSDTSALTFERLRVPADQLLGGSVVRPFEM